MTYKMGHCPQCNEQIGVQDSKGRWSSFKANFRQADLKFESGTRMRTIICETCFSQPDITKLMDAILHPESQACSGETMKNYIQTLGTPIGISLAPTLQGQRIGREVVE